MMANRSGVPNVERLLRRTAQGGWSALRLLLLIGSGFVLLYPMLYMVTMAFRPPEDIYDPTVIWVSSRLTLENLKNAYELMDYPSTVRNTVLVNLGSSALQVIVCSMTGYAFARFRFRGKGALFFVVLFTIIVPPQITATPQYINYQFFDFFGIATLIRALGGPDLRVSLIDSVFAMYLPAMLGAGLRSGLFVFLFRQFYRGLPRELEDAASIDGCSFFSCYVRVMIPNALSVTVTSFILSAVWYWNDYFVSSMYMSNKNTIMTKLLELPVASKMLYGMTSNDPYKIVTLLQGGCLLTVFPLLIAYAFLQRYLIKSVADSGIVG